MSKEQQPSKSFFEELMDFTVKNTTENIQRMFNLKDVLEYKYKPKKGYTPNEEVFRYNKMRILRYLPDAPKKYKTPLLFVYSLINRWYVVDLMEDRSLMNFLASQGYDVYITDWGKPTRSDKYLGLHEYVNEYMEEAVNYILKTTGQDKISLYGYCLGGTLCVIYNTMHNEKVRNLITMTTPVDFQTKGLYEKWSDKEYFDADKIAEIYPIVPPDFLESAFAIKNASSSLWKAQTFWDILISPSMLKNYFAMEGWLADNVPIVGKVYAEVIKELYQNNKLLKGTLNLGGNNAALKNITASILNVVATRDNIVPPAASLCLNENTSSKDAHDLILNGGHIGIVAGGIAQKKLWPGVVEWLSPRSN